MWRYSVFILIIVYFAIVDSACSPPKKYYISCGSSQSLSSAIQFCARYGMSLVNLTNSSSLINDIKTLNQTLVASNCYSYFWFASGNQTGLVGSITTLGDVLSDLLAGVLNLVLGQIVGGVLNLLTCLLGICPATTTPAPITSAMTVCVRRLQQGVIQKCLIQSTRSDMRTFSFSEQPMYGGIIDTFPSRSRTTCIGLCSSDDLCIGISYINGICSLYM